jgi:hypothetical protein
VSSMARVDAVADADMASRATEARAQMIGTASRGTEPSRTRV